MRTALLAATALWPAAAFAQAGSNNFSALPTGANASTLQSVMQNNAVASGEFQGNNITLPAGSITAGSGQSITAPDGNVYSLQMMGNMPMGVLYMNGSPAPGASQYIDAIVLSGNTVYAEDGKGHGWFTYSNGNWSGPGGAPGQTDGTVSGSAADTAATSNPAPITGGPMSDPSAPCTEAGAVTPGNGSFTANGNTYSVDATNGDVASVNGAPINQGAYETSQLVQGSDGAIYGQSNAANNNGQWFQLSSDGSNWQPLSGTPSAITSASSGSSAMATAAGPVVCPTTPSIQAQISAAQQEIQQLTAQLHMQQQATPTTTAPVVPSTVPAVTLAPVDSTSSGAQ